MGTALVFIGVGIHVYNEYNNPLVKMKDFESEIAKKAGCDDEVIKKVKEGGKFSQDDRAKINTSPETREFVENHLKSKGGDKYGTLSLAFDKDGHLKPEVDLVGAYEEHVLYSVLSGVHDF